MLLIGCILSGCDYLGSMKGIGFKKAMKLVEDAGKDDTFMEAMTAIRDEGKIEVPRKYEKKFMKALLTFKFQLVYCPKKHTLVHLEDIETHPLAPKLNEMSKKNFIGVNLSDEIA